LNLGHGPKAGETIKERFFLEKRGSKSLMPFDLTGHILASFLNMGNIFLHNVKIIDSIEESGIGGVRKLWN
jgi:hypothetical protein